MNGSDWRDCEGAGIEAAWLPERLDSLRGLRQVDSRRPRERGAEAQVARGIFGERIVGDASPRGWQGWRFGDRRIEVDLVGDQRREGGNLRLGGLRRGDFDGGQEELRFRGGLARGLDDVVVLNVEALSRLRERC